MRLLRYIFATAIACAAGLGLGAAPARALTLQFDYSHDGGFFTDPQVNPQADAARAALEYAGKTFEVFTDRLSGIESGDPNTWKAYFTSPADGSTVEIVDKVVPADTIIVYAGGRILPGSRLGIGGTGWAWAYGTQAWLDTVLYRGQAGAAADPKTDFARWGGSVVFDSDEVWNFGIDEGPSGNDENDFLSVALHELSHALGFGTAESWDTYVDSASDEFLGPASMAAYGGPAPLAADESHWLADTESTVGGEAQEAAMDPDLTVGERKRLTVLDLAAMQDIGWEMPLTGDADRDGDVDAHDYLILKAHLGGAGFWTDGDFDFDGDVDRLDFLAMAAAADGATKQLISSGAVPEPASGAILLLGLAAALRRRRR